MDRPETPAGGIAPPSPKKEIELQKSRKIKKRGRPPRATAMPHARIKHGQAFQWLERSPASETTDVSPAARLVPVENKNERMQNGDDIIAMSGVAAGIFSPIPPECFLPEQNPYALAISSLDTPFGLVPAPAREIPLGQLRQPPMLFTQTMPYLYELGPNFSGNRFMDSVSELFPAPAMNTQTLPNWQEQSPDWSGNMFLDCTSELFPAPAMNTETMPNLQEQSPHWSENSLMNSTSESLQNGVTTDPPPPALPRPDVLFNYNTEKFRSIFFG